MPNTVTSWSHAVHSLNKGLIILRADGTIDNINDPLMKWPAKFGMSPKHLQPGISFFDVSPPEFDSSFALFYREFFLPLFVRCCLGIRRRSPLNMSWKGRTAPPGCCARFNRSPALGTSLCLEPYCLIRTLRNISIQSFSLLTCFPTALLCRSMSRSVPYASMCIPKTYGSPWKAIWKSGFRSSSPMIYVLVASGACIHNIHPRLMTPNCRIMRSLDVI